MVARRLMSALLVSLTISCVPKEKAVQAPAVAGPTPTESQLEWHEMETNAFVHFTTNTFTDKEWGYGDESPTIFDPTEFDAEQWIRTFKEVGFKGVILTCKHHDGFCLWPSEFTEHSVKNSPFMSGKGDVVKAVADACREHGLKFGIYVSPWDRNRADYGTDSYITYYRNQLEELFKNYGPIFEMWFDGANGGDGFYGGAREKRSIDGSTYYDWPNTLDMVRNFEPNIIFFSDAGPGVRWVGNERGIAGTTNWNTITPDTLFAGKSGIQELLNTGHEDGTAWIPAEVDVSIRPGWFFHPDENDKVKTPEELFQIYLSSVGRGSTLLLNVPPDRRGLLHENDVQTLKAWRTLIDSTFQKNLALQAKATANTTRGNLEIFSATNVTDDNRETYWATDDGVTRGSIEIQLDQTRTFTYVLLQEYIKLGQRVKSFTVECWVGDNWKTVATGTTIGYKRILPIDPVTTDKLRINVLDARACPLISAVEVY
jgi:alpha-L-fucosidase